ncbi:MAG: hypothetical protein B1H11_00700 [Desulfobacteraceae bacterium 4484_190.1]|nr:MAG: hypothetical protein B1H11_00700 [Desulfobacteraceae bacterium 4484_190.1]HDH87725.1 ABC transporter substrate-binding protein [Desulfobacteraceae bacterium]
MRRKRYGWLKLGLLSILVAALFFGVVPLSMAEKGNVLERKAIGVIRMFEINDLTGPTADTCICFHEAFSDMIRDINKKGGIIYHDPKTKRLERVTIKFDFGDNKAKSGPVPMLYERLSTEKPKPVVAFCGSSAACEIMPKWSKRDQIPCIAGPSGMPIWNPPSWIFVASPDYSAQAAASAKWAMDDWKKKGKSGKPKWAWLTLDIPYGRAPIQPETINYINHLGFEIVGTWTIPFMPVDCTAELRAIKNAGANYFYGNTAILQEAQIMKDLTRLGLKDELQRVSNPYTPTLKMIDVAGAAADGLVGIHYMALPSEMDKPGVREASEMAKRHNRIFDSDYMEGWSWCKMDFIAIKRALEKKGYPITGADVYEGFIDPRGFDLGGAQYIRPYTKNENRGSWKVYMRKIEGGKLIRLTDFFEIEDMRPGGPWTPKK